MSFHLSPRAVADIESIGDYLAVRNPRAAVRLIESFRRKFRILGENPGIGAPRPDITEGLRHFPVGSYLVLYRETKSGVEIVRVVHGRRKLPDALGTP